MTKISSQTEFTMSRRLSAHNKLEKEKWELTNQLAQLKWIENTQIKTSEHGNKWKTSSKGTTKTKQSKKETNSHCTDTA